MDLVASDPQRTSDQHSSAVWGPVATLLWALVIAIVFLIVQIFVTIIYAVATMSDVPQAKAKAALRGLEFDGTFLSVGAFATLLVCVPLILGLAKLKSGSKLKDYLGLVVPRPGNFWYGASSPAPLRRDRPVLLLDHHGLESCSRLTPTPTRAGPLAGARRLRRLRRSLIQRFYLKGMAESGYAGGGQA